MEGGDVAIAKLPNVAVVVLGAAVDWPKLNTVWVETCSADCVAPKVRGAWLDPVVAGVGAARAAVAAAGVVVVEGAAPNWKVAPVLRG